MLFQLPKQSHRHSRIYVTGASQRPARRSSFKYLFFGAILYEMLSRRRAFQGESAAEMMSAVLKEHPPDLSETNQRVSHALERLVNHCLEKKS
jgi:serine/threonine protein kinase